MVAAYELRGGWLRVEPVKIGKRAFLGNSGMAAPGRSVPKNALVAVLSSDRLTTHWVLFCCTPDETPVSCSPSTTVGPRAYLVPLESQDTIWLAGLSHWSAASVYPTVFFQSSLTWVGSLLGVHLSLANSFCVAALTLVWSP